MKMISYNKANIKSYLANNSFYHSKNLNSCQALLLQGENKVLNLFKQASKKIPAYKDFLARNKIKPNLIKTMIDFKKIPLTTKDNYINKYPVEQRSWDKKLFQAHMISTSSGTTGTPCFWPRDLKTEIDGALVHEFILNHLFNIKQNKTLFINGFAMGNWIAGTYTSACINLMAYKGYPITLMSPGYDLDEVVPLLFKITPKYEQTIITGHTPFLKEILEQASKQGFAFNKNKIKLLGTGQGITENWRDYINKLVKSKKANCFYNLYGSADAALMGFETQLSVLLRRQLNKNMKLTKKIFKDQRLPSLFQYDPRLIYFEEVNNELSITKYSLAPLIRYNIHDNGGIFDYIDLVKLVKTKNKSLIKNFKFPFVYLFGREKFMAKIYGAIIYTEHVQHALNHYSLQEYLTGRFLLNQEYDENQNPILVCRVELNKNIDVKNNLISMIEEIFVSEVRQLNSEYDYVLKNVGKAVRPKIKLYAHGHKKHFPKGKVKKTA